MMQFVLGLVFILGLSKGNGISDDALVKGIENTLGECTSIVEAVGDFLHLLEEDDTRRRGGKNDSIAAGVTKKLKTCGAIIDAVDTFRENNFFPWKAGHIELRWSEIGFISQELKHVSKKTRRDSVCSFKGRPILKPFPQSLRWKRDDSCHCIDHIWKHFRWLRGF